MHKLFILNLLVFNLYAPIICMNRLIKRTLKPCLNKFSMRSFSTKKELAYKLFGLEKWDRQYCKDQIEEIYAQFVQLYHPDVNQEFKIKLKSKIKEIVDSYYIIKSHQHLVTSNYMYASYTITEDEFKEIMNRVKKDYQDWKAD